MRKYNLSTSPTQTVSDHVRLIKYIKKLLVSILNSLHFFNNFREKIILSLKPWYSLLPGLTLSIAGTVWKTRRQVYLLCRWKRHLAGFPHLRVADRSPKRACKSALIAIP